MIYGLLGYRVLGFRHLRAEFMGFGIQTFEVYLRLGGVGVLESWDH